MAFTAAQKTDIRKYLGVTHGHFDESHRLESMMDRIGLNDPEAETMIAGWLAELTNIDTSMTKSATSSTVDFGALKKVDEVEFHAPSKSSAETTVSTVDRGRMLIMRLARALGVSDFLPHGDYFGASQVPDGELRLA